MYQHTQIPLALPCRLLLPDSDPAPWAVGGTLVAPNAQVGQAGQTTQVVQTGATAVTGSVATSIVQVDSQARSLVEKGIGILTVAFFQSARLLSFLAENYIFVATK